MVDIVFKRGGTEEKYIGDALLHLARFHHTGNATEAVDQFQSELDPEGMEGQSGTTPIA